MPQNALESADSCIRANFNIPKSDYQKLRIIAVERETNVSDLVRQMITSYLLKEAEISQKEWNDLQEIAAEMGETVTQLVSTLIRGYIDAHKAINN